MLIKEVVMFHQNLIQIMNMKLYESLIPTLLKVDGKVTVCLENLFSGKGKNFYEGTCSDPHQAVAYIDALNAKAELVGVQKREYATLTDTVKMYGEGAPFENSMKFHQVMFAFNSAVFVPFPFEMFTEIAQRLKAYSPFAHTLCLCNTNDSHFYLPTQEQIVRGGYEIDVFLHGNVYKLKEDTDDTVIRENLRLMKEHADGNQS